MAPYKWGHFCLNTNLALFKKALDIDIKELKMLKKTKLSDYGLVYFDLTQKELNLVGKYALINKKSTRTYTVYVEYPQEIEEIDVLADNTCEARSIATSVLEIEYEPGGKIVHIEERFGWYF